MLEQAIVRDNISLPSAHLAHISSDSNDEVRMCDQERRSSVYQTGLALCASNIDEHLKSDKCKIGYKVS